MAWFSRTVPGGAADTEEYGASDERFHCVTPDGVCEATGTAGAQIIAIMLGSRRGHCRVQFFEPMSEIKIFRNS
jgi:hypothetical protein